MFALAANKTLKNGGRIENGSLIFRNMFNISFMGILKRTSSFNGVVLQNNALKELEKM